MAHIFTRRSCLGIQSSAVRVLELYSSALVAFRSLHGKVQLPDPGPRASGTALWIDRTQFGPASDLSDMSLHAVAVFLSRADEMSLVPGLTLFPVGILAGPYPGQIATLEYEEMSLGQIISGQ